MSKAHKPLVDTLPVYLRRACSCMSADGGFRDWLDARYGAGKWVQGEYGRGDFEVLITGRDLADLAVEYGHTRLAEHFGQKNPSENGQTHSKIQHALKLGLDAVTESFDFAEMKDDHLLAEARYQAISEVVEVAS